MNLPLRQKKIMKKLFYTGPRNCTLTCGALFWPCMHRNALVRIFFRKLQSGAKWWRKEKTKVPNWEVMWRQVTVWRRKNVNMYPLYRHHSHTPIICEIIFYAKYFSIFSSYHLPVFLHSLHRMHPALLFGHYTNCAVGQKSVNVLLCMKDERSYPNFYKFPKEWLIRRRPLRSSFVWRHVKAPGYLSLRWN